MCLTTMHNNPLSAPVAVTAKNADFHAVYIAFKEFFINKICVLRSKVISKKHGKIMRKMEKFESYFNWSSKRQLSEK